MSHLWSDQRERGSDRWRNGNVQCVPITKLCPKGKGRGGRGGGPIQEPLTDHIQMVIHYEIKGKNSETEGSKWNRKVRGEVTPYRRTK